MNNDLIIEKATLSDINSILEVENVSFDSDQFSRRQFAYLIIHSKGIFYVVKLNGRVIAYLSLLYNVQTNRLRIYSIAVHPEARGRKIAQLLMEKAIEYAKSNHVKAISLEVKISNLTAITLYEKNGFTKVSIKEHYYHDGSDAYIMVLTM